MIKIVGNGLARSAFLAGASPCPTIIKNQIHKNPKTGNKKSARRNLHADIFLNYSATKGKSAICLALLIAVVSCL